MSLKQYQIDTFYSSIQLQLIDMYFGEFSAAARCTLSKTV